MNKFNVFLVLAFVTIASINCQANDHGMSKEEIAALTRDGNYRLNPDGLLNGFLAAWPVVLYCLAAACLVIAFLGGFAHITGICKTPKQHVPIQQEE